MCVGGAAWGITRYEQTMSSTAAETLLTLAYYLPSADVLINCICCSGCGRGPLQFQCGGARLAEWAPLQSPPDLDHTLQKQVSNLSGDIS